MKSNSVLCRTQLELAGDVQGIGLRPQLALLANKHQLVGFVVNVNDIVALEVQGNVYAIENFTLDLAKLTSVCDIQVSKINIPVLDTSVFEIRPSKLDVVSSGDVARKPLRLVRFPGDHAVCSTCVDELFSKENRRYGYGFIGCAQCGPRYSVMTAVPYDRTRTWFSEFPLCELCEQEYSDVHDRRYHAETISCQSCGPRWQLFPPADGQAAKGESDIALANVAAKRLIGGDIMCVQGVSGFHLLVNAVDKQAVQFLRNRKQRPRKPFALMMKDIAMVRRYCHLGNEEADALLSSKAPLVLLKQRANVDIAHEVAPDNPYLAVMLPSTSMQHLLFRSLDVPLVATSANRSGEPIEYEPVPAKENLALVADSFLSHNLRIENPQDDSIVHIVMGKLTVLRRGRGYSLVPETAVNNVANNAVFDHAQDIVVLSAGGHVKNTIALGTPNQVVLSPHIGDLDTLASTRRYQRAIEQLCNQQTVTPNVYICDIHPQYHSSEHAEQQSAILGNQGTVKVGHHFAHALACRFEHHVKGLALMVVWDGLGMGQGDTLWGSEFFVDDGSGQGFPVAALLPFPLPGGDLAAKQPKRMGLSLLMTCGLPTGQFLQHQFSELMVDQQQLLVSAIEKSIQTPMARSMGRLLDGISSLLNLCQNNTFEGEAAMALQYAAERGALIVNNTSLDAPYDFSVIKAKQEQGCQLDVNYWIDWRPMVQQVVLDKKADMSVDVIAFRIHKTLVDMVSWVLHAINNSRRVSRIVAEDGKIESIIVSGGCFQNRLLIEILSAACEQQGVPLHWPQKYPANDGGLALGQWVVFQRSLSEPC